MTFELPPGPVVLEPQDDPRHPLAPWFAGARRRRREHYAGRAPRHGTRALVTMVHNEPVFLPIWLRYYSRFFAPDDIYVLDNDTHATARPTGDGFVRIPVDARHRRPHLDGADDRGASSTSCSSATTSCS